MNKTSILNETQAETTREKTIVRTSIIGIVANVFLAAFKAAVGLMSNSIAIILDAVNNISDAGSSLITIVGAKLAGRQPDKKHPFGYGRIEYLSAMIISIIVLYAGITSFVESVKQIIHPETPDYSVVSLVIVAVAVVVKFFLGRYVKATGEKVNSDSLVNSGEDARLDSVISASTLVAAVIFLAFGLSLEAWLGAVISLVIIKSGVGMLRETLSKILGERADAQLARDIKATVTGFPDVTGAYDLILHNYGPDVKIGSLHISVYDTMNALDIHGLTRRISTIMFERHGIIMTVGVYAAATGDNKRTELQNKVIQTLAANKEIVQVHGFYYSEKDNMLTVDVVPDDTTHDDAALVSKLTAQIEPLTPGLQVTIVVDHNYCE